MQGVNVQKVALLLLTIFNSSGRYIGGRYCLDYTWKLVFGISTEDWNNRCSNIKSHKDFYDFCEWLGVNYKKDGIIYKRGEKYDEFGKKIE